jgi:hypothetical protein
MIADCRDDTVKVTNRSMMIAFRFAQKGPQLSFLMLRAPDTVDDRGLAVSRLVRTHLSAEGAREDQLTHQTLPTCVDGNSIQRTARSIFGRRRQTSVPCP